MAENTSFKARLKASAPAPHDETPEYARFSQVYAIASPVTFVVAAYATCFALGARLDDLADWLAQEFPLLAPRITFLHAWDVQSVRAFAATLVSGALLFPVFLLINAIGYWKTVVRPGACRPFSQLTGVFLGMALIFLAITFAVCLLVVPRSFNAHFPGITSVIFWPNFPWLGALGWSVWETLIFNMFAAIAKFALCRRTRKA